MTKAPDQFSIESCDTKIFDEGESGQRESGGTVVMPRWKSGIAIAMAAGLWGATGSHAVADVSLKLSGIYGDELGCKRTRGQQALSDGGLILSRRKFSGWETSCRFIWAHSVLNDEGFSASKVWSVIALCASEGEAHSRLFSIEEDRGTAILREGQKDPVILTLCN